MSKVRPAKRIVLPTCETLPVIAFQLASQTVTTP